MVNKNEAKYIQSLYHKKKREEEQLFLAEGPKMVAELLQSDFIVRKVYAVEKWIEDNKDTIHNIDIVEVTKEELERISQLQTPNQVLAIVEQKHLSNNPTYNNTITLLLDGIQDPGNMGTIIRLADWFGIEQIIASVDTVDLYNAKVVQATMGSITRVKIWYEDLPAILETTTVAVYGAMLEGKNMYDVSPLQEAIILIGNEGKGIRQNLLPFIETAITIPRKGKAESLNAAIATGILLSHLIKL